jgi:cytidine deaminase
LNLAQAAAERAYAPYSKYRVGAALVTASGKLFSGCNVENASYGATICAERTAISTMVASGMRDLVALCVFAEGAELPHPCGVCRQVIWEFGADVDVLISNGERSDEHSIRSLLPHAFVLRR